LLLPCWWAATKLSDLLILPQAAARCTGSGSLRGAPSEDLVGLEQILPIVISELGVVFGPVRHFELTKVVFEPVRLIRLTKGVLILAFGGGVAGQLGLLFVDLVDEVHAVRMLQTMTGPTPSDLFAMVINATGACPTTTMKTADVRFELVHPFLLSLFYQVTAPVA